MADKLAARQKVIDLARTLVGSHYLWGSTGGTPYLACGSPHLPGPVTVATPSLDPRAPCVHAARCDASGHYVCAGRFRKVGGSIINDVKDRKLTDFLDDCEVVGNDVMYVPHGAGDTWQSLFASRLTPRVIVGDGVEDLGGTVITGRIVWGEDCTHVRHFDCLGFISYVLNQTTKKYFNPQQTWGGAIEDYYNITEEVDKADPAVPGDILFRGEPSKKDPRKMSWHHIAFLGEDNKVVQAEMAVRGVHVDERYNGVAWTSRRRLADKYLP